MHIMDNTGKELLAKEVTADDKFLGGLKTYVKGVEGKALCTQRLRSAIVSCRLNEGRRSIFESNDPPLSIGVAAAYR